MLSLALHMKSHAAGIGQKECSKCDKKFSSDFYFENHVCETEVFCEICEKEFKHKKDFYNHTCEGEDKVKVKCFVCKKLFSPLGQALERHIKRMHSKTKKNDHAQHQLDEESVLSLIMDVGISDRKLLKILRNRYFLFCVVKMWRGGGGPRTSRFFALRCYHGQ